jgi:Protein of unknown function (Hypoth_ymh)
VNAARKLELLREHRDAAQTSFAGRAELEAWREKTATVLRLTMGDKHEQTYSFDNISYLSRVSSNANVEITMRRKGIDRAVALLDAVIFEVEVADEDEGQEKTLLSFDEELWASVGYLAEVERWEHLVTQAVVFFEDWTRKRASLPNATIGDALASAAYKPGGPLALGAGGNASEGEGWLLMAKGLVMAVRNVAGHRIEQRADGRTYAFGVLGTISLLMTQVKFEYPI